MGKTDVKGCVGWGVGGGQSVHEGWEMTTRLACFYDTVENRLTPSHHHFLHLPPLPPSPLQSDSKTKRLSSHFESLLADREALIDQLATQESTLKHALEDKAQAERKLKDERQRLLSVGVCVCVCVCV